MALVNMMMLSRAVKTAAAARTVQRVGGVAAVEARAFATDADAGDKKPPQQQRQQQQRPRKTPNQSNQDKNLLFGEGKGGNNKGENKQRKFAFELKDKQNKGREGSYSGEYTKREDGDSKPQGKQQQQGQPRKKFAFAPSVKAKEKQPELEKFDAPAYFNEDFPVDFDESMKHEVEKLEIFADFTMLIDSSWMKQIHPLFDGSAIDLILNAPLEDFDERLFIDDKNTYDTKVIMEVPLSCFTGLSPQGLEIVKQLAGPRYNANKKQLKLTEDRYPSRVHNHKRLCDVLRDLTQNAHELSAAQTVDAQE